MANISNYYNASYVEPQEDFAPLPAGWYDAEVTETSVEENKAGNGSYIKVRFDIVGPTHAGRVVFSNYTLEHTNPKAVTVGHSKFRQLHEACGVPVVTDTDQIVGRRVAIKLTIKKSLEYGDSNEVKSARAPEGASRPTAPRPNTPPPAGPPRGPASPPPPARRPGPPAAAPPAATNQFEDDDAPF